MLNRAESTTLFFIAESMAKFPRICNIQTHSAGDVYLNPCIWYTWMTCASILVKFVGPDLSSQCTSKQTAGCIWLRTEETIIYILWKCILKSIFLNILLTTLQKPAVARICKHTYSLFDQFFGLLVVLWKWSVKKTFPFLSFPVFSPAKPPRK